MARTGHFRRCRRAVPSAWSIDGGGNNGITPGLGTPSEQERRASVAAPDSEEPGPGDQGAITGDLVMLHRLRRADDGGIKHPLVRHFTSDIVSLADQPIDGGTLDPFGLLPSFLKT